MSQEQQNNPLHGLKLEQMVKELVDFYGWDILDTAMRFNCFHTKPSIESSVKYLRKSDWAREVRSFLSVSLQANAKTDSRGERSHLGSVPLQMVLCQESP